MTGQVTYDITFVFREAGRSNLVITGATGVEDLPSGQVTPSITRVTNAEPPSITRVTNADGSIATVNWADVSYRVLKTVNG